MFTKEFNFDLPQELIAQTPAKERGGDKLLMLNKETGKIEDKMFSDLPDMLPKNALMVFNNSKVRRARLYANSASNSETEFLMINPMPQSDGSLWQVMVKRAKRQKAGKTFTFGDGTKAEIIESAESLGGEFRCLKFNKIIDDVWLDRNGHIPLPPYIRRGDTEEDADRYQTVYAQAYGSIAAPTAGLHFTQDVLDKIKSKGIGIEYITLHVGLGTFLPVRAEKIEEHKMHTEHFFIPEKTAHTISEAKKTGRPIIAVGTTSVRTLESAWDEKACTLTTGAQSTDIFIYPSYKFKIVDKLFTNFHTPESSLVMLVSAFAGKENIFNAYKYAIEKRYRFFSYGDAMLII